tara:strand:- start:780 stop:1478 length:699 start_codon:yes stop_codon:yes gene_type:complete
MAFEVYPTEEQIAAGTGTVMDEGAFTATDTGGSWLDDIINTLGPAAVSYGINTLFPGLTDTQRAMAGYQGGIPEYDVLRKRVPGTDDPMRRPGSSGRRYFTDVQYVPKGQGTPPALDPAALAAANLANPNRQTRPIPALAAGGIATMSQGRYLDGATDGMADKVPARIDGKQEARLSDGEFVVPADVVSHLGNGNSDAGAKALFAMMDRVRKARTGNKKQGEKINARKMLPA